MLKKLVKKIAVSEECVLVKKCGFNTSQFCEVLTEILGLSQLKV